MQRRDIAQRRIQPVEHADGGVRVVDARRQSTDRYLLPDREFDVCRTRALRSRTRCRRHRSWTTPRQARHALSNGHGPAYLPVREALAGILMIAGALMWIVALFIGGIGAVSVFKAV